MDDPAVITDLLAQLGVLGVLVWFMYYTVKVTIPHINRENADALRVINEKHDTLIGGIVADHKATVADLADRFDRNLREERDARRIEITEERKLRQQELAELASAMRDVKQHSPNRKEHG